MQRVRTTQGESILMLSVVKNSVTEQIGLNLKILFIEVAVIGVNDIQTANLIAEV